MTVKEIDTTGFVVPVAGVNQQWNYSNFAQNTISTLNYVAPTNTNFPTATFADTGLSTTFVPNWNYHLDSYFQTSSNGVNTLGFVVKKQNYGVAVTGNPNDSCIFPDQVYIYSTPSYLMPFPTTMSTSWHTNLKSFVNFQLSVAAFQLNHTPCQKVTNTVRLDTVVGWGKLRVPTATGPSLAYNVLMIKRITVQKDSFYLAGAPAPTALLSAFGISQGQTKTTNRYMFWRENARYPLLLINFESNNFTKANSAFYDATAQVDPTGIEDVNQNSDINIYPNPNHGDFSIQFKQLINEPFELNIYNIFGQIIYTQKVNILDLNSQQIDVKNLNSGTYFVSIVSENKRLTSKLIVQ